MTACCSAVSKPFRDRFRSVPVFRFYFFFPVTSDLHSSQGTVTVEQAQHATFTLTIYTILR